MTQLKQRRQNIAAAWDAFVNHHTLPVPGQLISTEVVSSWRRSLQYLNPWKPCVPLERPPSLQGLWETSPLFHALQPIQTDLEQLVVDGALVAGIADELGRLLWTSASDYLQEQATHVHFMAGGCWDERSAGTNAIALALLQRRPQVVFATEHYLRSLHDWVCYAAPILHPQTEEMVGVFSVATTWEKHTPLGERAVAEFAYTLRRHLPASQRQAELQIHALGVPRVLFRGREIHLSQRQLEIVCLLILNQQGLSLAELHSALYGDDSYVALTSLKAELSHLRHLLDGQIGSRPYRLLVSTWADFVTLWQVLKNQQIDKVLNLYRGAFLPHSASPELEEWRNCIEAVMEQVVADCRDPEVLLASLCHGIQGSERVRERLAELME